MPFPRRGRRRPFINSRWQIRRIDALCLYLSTSVRSTLTAWMKIYGETNDVAGLITGPIEVRFRRLREHTGADLFLLWTTSERWAAGEALSLTIPAIGLVLDCRFDEGRLFVDKAKPTGQEDRDPRRLRTAIGMELRPESIELPTSETDGENASAGLVAAFEKLLDRRWTSFVDPLREALEAEARDDATRAEKLATPYAVATPRIGSQSESDPYRLSGVEASAVAAFDEGEWLDLVDTRGRVISSARLVRIDPAEGVMDIDVRGADPPSEGIVRPRPQTQILAQKRAILEELDNPTGGLANAVKLVASPASLPPPQKRRPAAFVNRMVAQNRSQVRAVSLALGLDEGQALMIQGPPGTGKSTTLAEILGQLVTRDKNVTVLVCSHSNHGVDNLLLKTLPYLETVPELAIARVGLFDRVNPLARPHFVPPGEDLGAFNVVFTTVDALALQVEAGGRTYDYAVLDEANRASILDSLIPLVRGRRFILVGDHLQLQPVLSEAEEALRLEPAVGNNSAIGKSLFAWLRERRFPEAATIFLDEQNRMHPVIAGLISEVFYEGKLRSGRKAPRRSADVPLFPSPVTWVDTRGLHGLREARGRGASLVNVPEARLVATIARHILTSSGRDVDVGVISAYAEQTALLRRLLLHRNIQRQGGQNGANGQSANGKGNVLDRAALKHLEIDTVDAFEGREKDIILVSLVRSNRRRDIGFLRLMQRINVALSRARTMLIVVGDTSTLRGSYFDRIVRYIRANGMLVPGPRLIGRLLNARNGERPAAVAGERPGRRRRPLPSARTAFPEQDPAAAAAAAGSAAGAAADGEDAQRGRRRRRRVRGRGDAEQRPPTDRRSLQPTTTMELAPAEPGADEPATQYEIDRFAALVEQLLGDTGGDENVAGGDTAAPPEVDRAHAEEVLAEALRAVGEQADRTGSSRSRRGNNRRRSRRGQGRPLPGDAAIADAARRMAREELLAAEAADDGLPRYDVAASDTDRAAGYDYDIPPDIAARSESAATTDAPALPPSPAPIAPERPAARPFRITVSPTDDVAAPPLRLPTAPSDDATPPPFRAPAIPSDDDLARPAALGRSIRPFEPLAPEGSVPSAPSEGRPETSVPPATPAPAVAEVETARPRRTRRRVAPAAAEAAPALDAASTVPSDTPSSTPEASPVPAAAEPAQAPAAVSTEVGAPVRRTRRRVAAAAAASPATADAAAASAAPAPAALPSVEPAPAAPAAVPSGAESAAPVAAPPRRTRRVAAAAVPPAETSALPSPTPAAISAAPEPTAAPITPVASTAAASAAPEAPTESPAPATARPRVTRRRTPPAAEAAPPAADTGPVTPSEPSPARPAEPAQAAATAAVPEPAAAPKPTAGRGRRKAAAPSAEAVSAVPTAAASVVAESVSAAAPAAPVVAPARRRRAPVAAAASPAPSESAAPPATEPAPAEPPAAPPPKARRVRTTKAAATAVSAEADAATATNGTAATTEAPPTSAASSAPETKPRRSRSKTTAAASAATPPEAATEAPPVERPKRTRRVAATAASAESPADS